MLYRLYKIKITTLENYPTSLGWEYILRYSDSEALGYDADGEDITDIQLIPDDFMEEVYSGNYELIEVFDDVRSAEFRIATLSKNQKK